MNRKWVLIAASTFVFLFTIGALIYFFGSDVYNRFFPSETSTPGGRISLDQELEDCRGGDKTCEAKNEKILANRLDGRDAKFVLHQCDGPRACPTPTDEEIKVFTAAIKDFEKDTKLVLIRMSGITPTGNIYYCASDERCWGYNTKTKKVTVIGALGDDTETPTTESSASASDEE